MHDERREAPFVQRSLPHAHVVISNAHRHRMTTLIFRCPITGFHVEGFRPEQTSDEDLYEPVNCIVCDGIHMVNLATGKVLGEADDEAAAGAKNIVQKRKAPASQTPRRGSKFPSELHCRQPLVRGIRQSSKTILHRRRP